MVLKFILIVGPFGPTAILFNSNKFLIYCLGAFGFLTHEVEEGKKLFFHTSEVKDGVQLQPGDQVEFVLVVNQRTGKSSACNVTKIRYFSLRFLL